MNYAERLRNMVGDAKCNDRSDELLTALRDAIDAIRMSGMEPHYEQPPMEPSEMELRRQMQQHHPDRGGDPVKFRAASEAWREMKSRRSA